MSWLARLESRGVASEGAIGDVVAVKRRGTLQLKKDPVALLLDQDTGAKPQLAGTNRELV